MSDIRLRVVFLTFVAVTIPALASAGKPERDRQKELTPKVAEAKAAIKTACGCNVAVTVKWDSYKTADDMFEIHRGLDDVVSASKSHCDDADEKKVFCANVATYEVRYDKDMSVTVEGKKISCGTFDAGHCGDNQLNRELDKF